MLDEKLLSEFIKTFFGYGDLSSPLWGIGMEEGGGSSEANITKRLETWSRRGMQQLEDLASYHQDIGVKQLFEGQKPPLQRTWSKLIRAYLASADKDHDLNATRKFQRDVLGRKNSRTCLLELMPLPSPGVAKW